MNIIKMEQKSGSKGFSVSRIDFSSNTQTSILRVIFVTSWGAIEKFADRRHEVAHGIVRPIQWYQSAIAAESVPFQFCLVPPHYNRNWFDTTTCHAMSIHRSS